MVDESEPPTGEAVAEFLGRSGAVGVLCGFDGPRARFSHLVETSMASRQTVSRRLDESVELGLIERVEHEGQGTSHAYALTERGAEVRLLLDRIGATEKHRQLTRLQREFTESVKHVQEIVTEHGTAGIPDEADSNARSWFHVHESRPLR